MTIRQVSDRAIAQLEATVERGYYPVSHPRRYGLHRSSRDLRVRLRPRAELGARAAGQSAAASHRIVARSTLRAGANGRDRLQVGPGWPGSSTIGALEDAYHRDRGLSPPCTPTGAGRDVFWVVLDWLPQPPATIAAAGSIATIPA